MTQYMRLPIHKVMDWVALDWGSEDLKQDILKTIRDDAAPVIQQQELAQSKGLTAYQGGRPKQAGLPEDFPPDLWPQLMSVMRENLRENPDGWANDRGTPAVRPKTEQNKLMQGIVVWNNGIEAVFMTDDEGWPDPEMFMGPTRPDA